MSGESKQEAFSHIPFFSNLLIYSILMKVLQTGWSGRCGRASDRPCPVRSGMGAVEPPRCWPCGSSCWGQAGSGNAGGGISFEDIVFHIRQGDILDDLKHPNPDDYPEQRVMVVKVEEYAYLVPYIETAEEFFLKTIIPSRKATRKYLGE